MDSVKQCTHSNNKILYVLVIYGCTVEDSLSFQTLLSALPEEHIHLFVYDNSPKEQTTRIRVGQYVHDTTNGGLGKAYNEACRYANKHGYNWLLLLDDDTTFPANAVEKYREAIIEHPDIEMIVPRHRISSGLYMSPTHYRMKTSHLQDSVPTGVVSFHKASPINSGMMVSVRSFLQAGGYDEPVRLDFSDIRFIEKYKRHYHSFYVMPDVICTQRFSATDTVTERVYNRFLIYLECAAAYPKDTWLDSLAMLVTSLRPTLSHTLKKKSTRYLRAYWNIYLTRKKH